MKRITFYLSHDLSKDEMFAILGEALVEQSNGNIPILSVQKTDFTDDEKKELLNIILQRAEKKGFGIIIEPVINQIGTKKDIGTEIGTHSP